MICFYHYTTEDRYESMLHGYSYKETGLLPIRRILPLGMPRRLGLPEKAEQGAVYGVMEPMPQSWITNGFYDDQSLLETIVSDKFSHRKPMLLLKCETLPEDDAYVAEYAFHMRSDYTGLYCEDEEISKQVKQSYWNSMVPLDEYDGSYNIPEVICFSRIPPERLSVAQWFENGHDLVNKIRRAQGNPILLFTREKEISPEALDFFLK